MGRRPRHHLRLRGAPLALSVRLLPGRGRYARLAGHVTDAHPGADSHGRHPPDRQLRGGARMGRRPPHRLLYLRALARSVSVRLMHRAPRRERPAAAGPQPAARGARPMIIATTPFIAGHRVTETKGQAFGLVVRSRGFSGNIMAGLRSIAGGEIKEYTSLLEDTRRQAIDRLVKNATLMGANAVISMRFDSSELAGTMSEIVAYGTAVVVEPDATATQPTLE